MEAQGSLVKDLEVDLADKTTDLVVFKRLGMSRSDFATVMKQLLAIHSISIATQGSPVYVDLQDKSPKLSR